MSSSQLFSHTLFGLMILMVSAVKSQPVDEKEWQSLFAGNNLSDWRIKISGYPLDSNYANTFRAENGKIKVAYNEYAHFKQNFGHIFYKHPYSYYHLTLEYRFKGHQAPGGEGWAYRNSGIMLHCRAPETMGLKQDFPISIEMQLLGGGQTGERTTGNLCTPGTHVIMEDSLVTEHCINADSKTYRGDVWVRAEAIVFGDSLIHHVIEGDTVITYTKPQIGGGFVHNFVETEKKDGLMLNRGYIALQSESHPIEFRNIKILNLEGCTDPKAKNYKSYYVKGNQNLCNYE